MTIHRLAATVQRLYPTAAAFPRVPVDRAIFVWEAQPEAWEVFLACGHVLLGVTDDELEERMRCYRCAQEGRLRQ